MVITSVQVVASVSEFAGNIVKGYSLDKIRNCVVTFKGSGEKCGYLLKPVIKYVLCVVS